jgi:branched-subunit amino acid aminotransferase/4-amino-4-deoxychorismate lyase
MGEYFFLNGEILHSSKALLKITDLALLRGFGVFDFMRTHQKKPFLMDRYISRFFNSARCVELDVPFNKDMIKEVINDLLQKNQIFEAGIRLVLTGGYTLNGYSPASPNFFILIEKINFPTAEQYAQGIKLYFYSHQRELSHIKSINYISPIAIRNKIKEAGAFDVLYHFNGQVLEVSRSNFFIIREQRIITPDNNILPGITRASVIGLAGKYYSVEERPISLDELWQADEAFMTGTTKKILPVIQVGDHAIGKGYPGSVTRHLMHLYSEYENNPT